MGDVGDFWRDVKEGGRAYGQRKREHNKVSSTAMLKKHSIAFESRNDGNHLIVSAHGHVFDFWPSKGTWRDRSDKRSFRGVRELIGTVINLGKSAERTVERSA